MAQQGDNKMFFFALTLMLLGAFIGGTMAKLKMYRRMAFGFGPGMHRGRCGSSGRRHHFGHSPFGHGGHRGHGHGDFSDEGQGGFGSRGFGRGGPQAAFFEAMRDFRSAAFAHKGEAKEAASKLAEKFEGPAFEAEDMGELIEDARSLAEKVSADVLKRLASLHDELSPRERQRFADFLRRRA